MPGKEWFEYVKEFVEEVYIGSKVLSVALFPGSNKVIVGVKSGR